MQYLIKDRIELNRPLVFLCGPYYEEKPHDKRRILKKFLAKEFDKDVLPVIVDVFLDKDKINDSSISIPLMEEICAAVSAKTYIFLDTFSTVAELGIFSSAFYRNKICVITPDNNDKLINNINFFVREVYSAGDNISNINYRPKITRVPLASDYVVEYYEFPYNKLPQNIKNDIETDRTFLGVNRNLEFHISSEIPTLTNCINYVPNGKVIDININLSMMFYLITSIHLEFSLTNEVEIYSKLKDIIINTMAKHMPKTEVQDINKINTGLRFLDVNIVKHIIKFVSLFKGHAQTTGEQILTKATSFIQEKGAFEYFQLQSQQVDILKDYIDNPQKYVTEYKHRIGKKTRKVTKYSDSNEGRALRVIHAQVSETLTNDHLFSEHSYAYRKGYSILDCVQKHKNNRGFLKVDISKFFNSITYLQLYRIVKDVYSDNFRMTTELEIIIKSLLYKNQVSLGFVTSPILSDIYLTGFDSNIVKKIQEYYPSIAYTRYADDMCFSLNDYMDDNHKDVILEIVSSELSKLKLKINESKTKLINIRNIGDHFKLLGLNIIKHSNHGNKITLGKKYIYETAKIYLKYLAALKESELSEEDKFYKEKIISGRVAYIKQIEGNVGYNILRDRIKVSSEGRIKISTDKIHF